MGSGGGGGGGDSTTTIRYAPYVEERHRVFLLDMYNTRQAGLNNNPFKTFTTDLIGYTAAGHFISSAGAMFNSFYNSNGVVNSAAAVGGNVSLMKNFTSMFNTHNSFIYSINTADLYKSIYTETMTSPEMRASVVAEGKYLRDVIDTDSFPSMAVGARDINAVNASTFIIARSNLEVGRLKALEKYSTGLQFTLLPMVSDRWKTVLEWNKGVVGTYIELNKMYLESVKDFTTLEIEVNSRRALWPFTLLDHERAALGALQGATSASSHKDAGISKGAAVAGGALSGAAMGAYIGSSYPVVGTAIGAVVGGLAGLLSSS